MKEITRCCLSVCSVALGSSTIGKLPHLIHSRRLSTNIVWFTHVVADEATHGIDPAVQEQRLEHSFDSCVARKNPSLVWSLCKSLRYRVHVWLWRPMSSWIAASTVKASKGAPSMVHHVRTRRRPSCWVDPGGQPGTSMWRHWWPPGCCRNCRRTQLFATLQWPELYGSSARNIAQ